MHSQTRTATRGARPLRSLAFDQTQENPLTWELRQARTVNRILSGLLDESMPARLALSDIRVSQTTVVILAKSASQKSHLRQLLPRLEEKLRQAGFNQVLKIRVRPTAMHPQTRILPRGEPRHGNPQAALDMLEKAELIADPDVRNALIGLAKALQ